MSSKAFLLFKIFFKIGLFTFGGGYSMIPFIEKELTISNKFIEKQELLDIISISELTPGPISVNCATFIGYKVCGYFGALLSTLGVIIPSFIIILLISIFLDEFKNIEIILKFLNGVKIGVLILLISSVIKINSNSKKSKFHYAIILLVLFFTILLNIDTIAILVCSILIITIIYQFKKLKRR